MAYHITAASLLGYITHLALESQLSVMSLTPLFGTPYIDLYRPLIIPTLFAIALFGFLRQRKISKVSRWLQVVAVAYSSISILVARQVGYLIGENLGPWYGALAVETIAFYPILIGTASVMANGFHVSNSKATVNSGARLILISLAASLLFTIIERHVMGKLLEPIVFLVYPTAWSAMEKIQITNFASTLAIAMLSPARMMIIPIIIAVTAIPELLIIIIVSFEGYNCVYCVCIRVSISSFDSFEVTNDPSKRSLAARRRIFIIANTNCQSAATRPWMVSRANLWCFRDARICSTYHSTSSRQGQREQCADYRARYRDCGKCYDTAQYIYRCGRIRSRSCPFRSRTFSASNS
ncbi:hypothetical protein V1508DRAFT_51806 [Lipomyces doorenjongii]|uniref:uncharacterized protein n=1 Tax=Lipomyces doorenjongii TaxID=383834 RepID=UPI0034CF44AF